MWPTAGTTTRIPTPIRTNILPIDLNFIYTFIPKGRVSPYLSVGAGVVRWHSMYRPDDATIEKEVDPAFGVAGGLEIFLNETVALDLGAKWRYMLTDDKDMIGHDPAPTMPTARAAWRGPRLCQQR